MARWLDPTVYTVSGVVRNGHLSLSQSLAHRSETSFSMGASVHGVSALRSWPPAHISLARTTWSSGATPTFSFLPGRSPPARRLLAELLLFPVAHFFGQVAALSSGPPSAWSLRPLPLPRRLWRFEFPFRFFRAAGFTSPVDLAVCLLINRSMAPLGCAVSPPAVLSGGGISVGRGRVRIVGLALRRLPRAVSALAVAAGVIFSGVGCRPGGSSPRLRPSGRHRQSRLRVPHRIRACEGLPARILLPPLQARLSRRFSSPPVRAGACLSAPGFAARGFVTRRPLLVSHACLPARATPLSRV